jgi:hypothetical protein
MQKYQVKKPCFSIVTYSEAGHFCDIDIPQQRYYGHVIGYDGEAAADRKTKMLNYFNGHLTPDLKPA